LLAGIGADLLGFGGAIAIVAGLTAASGIWVALDLDAERGPLAERDAPSVDSAVVGHG
jgi:hypothetical protein